MDSKDSKHELVDSEDSDSEHDMRSKRDMDSKHDMDSKGAMDSKHDTDSKDAMDSKQGMDSKHDLPPPSYDAEHAGGESSQMALQKPNGPLKKPGTSYPLTFVPCNSLKPLV
ncbi:hypothetical protein FIBSPDRAFT_500316 [Athelia psychrophila]|uniref:Uncharacterized protein n=1 Tax=Athelia psychrophila TaxID=1759441 RepID=A0A166KAW3_9AGAM|nr:hypothetical protein FIBSPDRAFT_500316 [Fibularhizoctonia sp. CBS 109695]